MDVGIEQRMNQRYVDDINIAAKATVPGLRYVEGNIIMDTTYIHTYIHTYFIWSRRLIKLAAVG